MKYSSCFTTDHQTNNINRNGFLDRAVKSLPMLIKVTFVILTLASLLMPAYSEITGTVSFDNGFDQV